MHVILFFHYISSSNEGKCGLSVSWLCSVVNGHDEDCGRKMRIPEKPDLFTSFIKE